MKDPKQVYAIYCTNGDEWASSYDALWGDVPRVYTNRREAEKALRRLQTDGDWGDYEGCPDYYIYECTPEAVLFDHDLEFDALRALASPCIINLIEDHYQRKLEQLESVVMKGFGKFEMDFRVAHMLQTLLGILKAGPLPEHAACIKDPF